MFKRFMFTMALFSAISLVQAKEEIYFGEYADFAEYAPQLSQDLKKGADVGVNVVLRAQQKAAQGCNSLAVSIKNAVQSWKDSATSFIDSEKTLKLSDYPACKENVVAAGQSWKDSSASFMDSEKTVKLSNYPICAEYVAAKYKSWKDGVASFNDATYAQESLEGSAQGPVSLSDYFRTPEQPSWYSKIWNAEIAGYKGAGKYVIVGSAVVVGAVVVAYYKGFFNKKAVTLEAQIQALIEQAQTNPNIIIVELPKILATCDNDQVRLQLFQFVLSNVEITPEIQKAFEL